ncbi:MAG: peptidylprolyl isomerase, partial [Prevotella sp.]|nr:peptidylprolyl isomerase [Prevotella sp.]
TKDEAYGDYEAARVLDLERQMFCINGHFDHDHIYKDAIIPLQNEDGNRFYGRVLEIGTDSVKIDLNHPLAGKTLNFKGCVNESREATNDEIQGMINRLSGEGCGCGCHGGCHGDCGDGDCEDGCHGGCGCH